MIYSKECRFYGAKVKHRGQQQYTIDCRRCMYDGTDTCDKERKRYKEYKEKVRFKGFGW